MPRGTMPFAGHLRELRNRVLRSLLAIVLLAVIAPIPLRDP